MGDEMGGRTMDPVATEVYRVFGPADVVRHGDRARVLVEGWPDWQEYHAGELTSVLGRFADDHGTTEAGDAEVCAALERSGAVVAEVR